MGSLATVLLLLPIIGAAQQRTLEGAAAPTGPAIQIVEGDGAINSIRLHRGHDPIVRITTSSGKPIAGAAVTFLLPSTGPSGTFAGNEGLSLTAISDSQGLAVGKGLRPNTVAGQFRIRVNTAWEGSPAAVTLSQTNAEPVIHARHTKTIVIIVAVVAAAAGGAAVAAGGHGSNSNGTATTPPAATGSIISGTPSIGPPR